MNFLFYAMIGPFLFLFMFIEASHAAGNALEDCINDTMLATGKSRDEILPICIDVFKSSPPLSPPLTEDEYRKKLEERRQIIKLGRELNKSIAEVDQELKQRGLDDLKPPVSRQPAPRTSVAYPSKARASKRCRSLDTREFGLVPTDHVNGLWAEADLIERYGPPCQIRDNGRGYKQLFYEKDEYNNGALFKVVNGRVVSKTRIP